MPLTMAAAREHLPAERAGRVIAGLSVVGAAGVRLGYPITGFIADHGGVSAAYWFGTVLCAVALAAAAWAIPQPVSVPAGRRLDAPAPYSSHRARGGSSSGSTRPLTGVGSGRVLGLIAAGLAIGALWAWHELRTSEPLVELRLVRHRAVLTANVAGLLLGVTMYLSMVILYPARAVARSRHGRVGVRRRPDARAALRAQQLREPDATGDAAPDRDAGDPPARRAHRRRWDPLLRAHRHRALAGVRHDGHPRDRTRLHVRGDAGPSSSAPCRRRRPAAPWASTK